MSDNAQASPEAMAELARGVEKRRRERIEALGSAIDRAARIPDITGLEIAEGLFDLGWSCYPPRP